MSRITRRGITITASTFARKGGRGGRARWCLALCAATFALATAARAEIIQIPAITFVGRSDVQQVGDVSNGVLTNAQGTFYAPVLFPVHGQIVCRFTLAHRDNDAQDDITARLYRKRINVGGNPFVEPEAFVMASVQTTGGEAGVRRVHDRRIRGAMINLVHDFHYVELSIPGPLLEILAVRIDFGAAC